MRRHRSSAMPASPTRLKQAVGRLCYRLPDWLTGRDLSARPHSWRRRLLFWSTRVLLGFVLASLLAVGLLRWLPPVTTSFMMQSYLQGLWSGQAKATVQYRWVPYERISPYLALAVIAAEDQRFPEHWGFDWDSLSLALQANARGKPLRGASTISQQVAKNLYLWPGRSLVRKGLEAWFTLLIELLWSKQRILEVYLNIAEFGDGTFGAEAASRHFFHIPAQQLKRGEAALLAAVLPNPSRYQIEAPSPYVRRRQTWIVQQMEQLGGVGYLETF